MTRSGSFRAKLLPCLLAVSFAAQVVWAQAVDAGRATLEEAVGIRSALEQLQTLRQAGSSDATAMLALRQDILVRILAASFDVDDTLARIDAEQAHANDVRNLVEAQREHRQAVLNVATFTVSGALGAAGSAMQLTRGLDHAGNAVAVAGSISAVGLAALQLKVGGGSHEFRSPYNMLAEVLGQTPNGDSRYPAVVLAYLHVESSGDGQPADNLPPEGSLRTAWYRLHRLQDGKQKDGSTVASVTSDPSQGLKLTADQLDDREAMLRDLHGAIALLKVELRRMLSESELNPTMDKPVVKP